MLTTNSFVIAIACCEVMRRLLVAMSVFRPTVNIMGAELNKVSTLGKIFQFGTRCKWLLSNGKCYRR